jgi:hypothetical protein
MSLTIPSSIAEIIPITMPLAPKGNGADAADVADDIRPILVIDKGDLPNVAKQLRDIIAKSRRFFDRGGPARIDWRPKEEIPIITQLNKDGVVIAAHEVCRPVNVTGEFVTLPDRFAALYLAMIGEWNLLPLVSISTAPILAEDGTIQTAAGYQTANGVFCCNIPQLSTPPKPTRAEAEVALTTLRETFRTFPFSDAKRKADNGVEVVDLDQPAGFDESAFLGLLTAICRRSGWRRGFHQCAITSGFWHRQAAGAGTSNSHWM